MGLYNYSDGVLTPIAGRGKAEYGASTVRKGTYSFANASAVGWRYATVTFDTPMVDTDYEIILTPSVGTTSAQSMSTAYTIDNKTINGFRISYYDMSATSNVSGNYTAFKLYTDNEYNNLLTLSRPDLWPLNTEITFENGLFGMRQAGNITLSANTQNDLTVVPKSAGLTTTAKFIDCGGWWGINPGFKYFINVSWGTNIQTCYWLDIRSGISDVPCIRLAFLHPTAGTYAYDTWVTYTKS